MRKLSSLSAIFFLTTMLAACGSISISGKYIASGKTQTIEMNFDQVSSILTMSSPKGEAHTEFAFNGDQLLLDQVPAFTVLEAPDHTFELYSIDSSGQTSDEVTYTLTKK